MSSTFGVFRSVATLGAATLIDYMIQLALPVAMVRLIDGDEYAKYRMLFLIVTTAMALAPLYMPQALFYFLPKSNALRKERFVKNTIIFLGGSGFFSALMLNPFFTIIPDKFFSITENTYLIPVFICVWVLTSLVDSLPNAMNKIRVQALVLLGLSCARIVTVVSVAWFTADIEYVFFSLCLFLVFKDSVLIVFIMSEFGL